MKMDQLKDLVHDTIVMQDCTGTIAMSYGARTGSLVATAAVQKLDAALNLMKEEVTA